MTVPEIQQIIVELHKAASKTIFYPSAAQEMEQKIITAVLWRINGDYDLLDRAVKGLNKEKP